MRLTNGSLEWEIEKVLHENSTWEGQHTLQSSVQDQPVWRVLLAGANSLSLVDIQTIFTYKVSRIRQKHDASNKIGAYFIKRTCFRAKTRFASTTLRTKNASVYHEINWSGIDRISSITIHTHEQEDYRSSLTNFKLFRCMCALLCVGGCSHADCWSSTRRHVGAGSRSAASINTCASSFARSASGRFVTFSQEVLAVGCGRWCQTTGIDDWNSHCAHTRAYSTVLAPSEWEVC